MACQRCYELISQRLDGELSEGEQQELESHLAVCPSCRALAQQLSGLHEDFSMLEEVPAPEGFAQGVMDRIRMEEKKKVIPLFRRPQFKAVAGLAACLVLCAGIYGTGQLSLPGEQAAAQITGSAQKENTADGQEEEAQENLSVDTPTADSMPKMSSYAFADGETQVGEATQEEPQEEIPVPRAYNNVSTLPPADENRGAEAGGLEENSQQPQQPTDVLTSQPPQENQNEAQGQPEQNGTEPTAGTTGVDAQPETEARAFQNEQSFSVTYGATPQASSAVILGSVSSLTDYLAEFPEDDLSAVSQAYDEAYFETRCLLAILMETESSSISFTIQEDGLSAGQVVLEENRPQEGTCDMAAWLIVAEVGTEFSDGEQLEVSVVIP